MSNDAPAPGTALTRASNGRPGVVGSLADPGAWRDGFSVDGLPGLALVAICVAVFVAQLQGALTWDLALSGQALAEGRWYTLVTHMFAHGGLGHLLVNAGALLGLTVPIMKRIGAGPGGWLRYLAVFLLSGLAGAGAYLALHPAGVIGMVGASGAVFGLWGLAARLRPDGGLAGLGSKQVRREIVQVVQINVVLFVIFWAMSQADGGGGLAWEAHAGGFLFGLLLGPLFLPRRKVQPQAA